MRWAAGIAALAVAATAAVAHAQDADDLARIPKTTPEADAPVAGDDEDRSLYIDAAASLADNGGGLPAFSSGAPDRQGRLSLNYLQHFALADSLRLSLSDRMNFAAQNGQPVTADNAFSNDLREAYLTWRPSSDQVVQIGRLNVRNGVALSFSPIDYFKSGSAVVEASADPAKARAGRLGVAMVQYQKLWPGGSVTFAFAPKLAEPQPLDEAIDGVDPGFNRTNDSNRALATLNLSGVALAPQVSVLLSGGDSSLGLSASRPVGKSIVLYAEGAVSHRRSLLGETAALVGRDRTPPGSPALVGSTVRATFVDLVLGGSWSNSQSKITVYAEYNFHEAGLDAARQTAFFAAAAQAPATGPYLGAVREVAAREQAPFAQHQLFFLVTRDDAWRPNLTLGALGVVNLHDGSVSGQAWASYAISQAWSVASYVSGTIGDRRSEYGSLPTDVSATVQLLRYF